MSPEARRKGFVTDRLLRMRYSICQQDFSFFSFKSTFEQHNCSVNPLNFFYQLRISNLSLVRASLFEAFETSIWSIRNNRSTWNFDMLFWQCFYDLLSLNSVGIENVEDLRKDLEQALERVIFEFSLNSIQQIEPIELIGQSHSKL